MKIETRAVHAGDRKKDPNRPGGFVPVATPIYAAASFVYDSTAQLDRVLGREEPGYCYARYDNPTNSALEDLMTDLEGGAGSLACSSGMMAIHVALMAALLDRNKAVLAADSLYGASTSMLTKLVEPFNVEIDFVDVCDLDAVRKRIGECKPGAVLMETISNPLLRVGEVDRIAQLCQESGVALIVDNTFATPLMIRPLALGANLVVHSATKFLSGHGDVLGGTITSDAHHVELVRSIARTLGPALGPFESYLAMRGIKTFPLRMERQCANASRVATWLAAHPKIRKVHYLADPQHPDADVIRRLLPEGLHGAIVTLEMADSKKADVFDFMDRLKVIVRATSLGDVHSTVLYPAISSHRDISPRQRERMGILDSTVRLCIGIENIDDIIEDLEQALATQIV